MNFYVTIMNDELQVRHVSVPVPESFFKALDLKPGEAIDAIFIDEGEDDE